MWRDENGRVWAEGDCYTLIAGWTWERIVAGARKVRRDERTRAARRTAGGAVAWGAFLPSNVVYNICASEDLACDEGGNDEGADRHYAAGYAYACGYHD